MIKKLFNKTPSLLLNRNLNYIVIIYMVMVAKLIQKLLKLDLMGALRVKYYGVPVGTLAVALIFAYRLNIGGVRDGILKPLFDFLLRVPVVGWLMTVGMNGGL